MKKIMFLFCLMLLSINLFSQESTPDLNSLTISKIWGGVLEFWNNLNWVFIVIFIVISGIFNMYVTAENKAISMNWFRKIPMAIWVLLIGIFLGISFVFIYDLKTKQEIFGILLSIIFSMGIYKLGIDKFIKWVASKFGLEFKK